MHVSRAPGAMIKKSKTLTEGEFFSTVVFPREDDFIEGKRWAHTRVQKMEGKSFQNTHPSSIWFEGGHQNYSKV